MEVTQEQVTQMVKTGLEASGFTEETAKTLKEVKDVKRIPIGESGTVTMPEPEKFKTFGEQLMAVYKSKVTGIVDNRLVTAKQTGLEEGIDHMGGYLVQPEFMAGIMKRSYEMGAVLSRCRKLTIGSNANSITINAIAETSRANGSRWGGILGYWLAEGGTKLPSHPEFRQMCLTLHKVIGLCYATDELLQDTSVLEQIISQGFAEEIQFQVENAIINGTGVGQPLGVVNSPALIGVARAGAGAIASADIFNMWIRMYAPSRANAVWFINQDVEAQLFAMSVVVGLGGVPVWLPANGLSSSPFSTLMGKPVIPIEYCPTMANANSIILADMSQYMVADKGGLQTAVSGHVAYLTDEQVFRFVYRVDGQPLWNAALTPFQGANTQSPFVGIV